MWNVLINLLTNALTGFGPAKSVFLASIIVVIYLSTYSGSDK